MINLNLPIVIQSKSVQFIIAGSINRIEGMFIKSTNVSNEFIAYTKLVYEGSIVQRNGNLENVNYLFKNFNFIWSEYLNSINDIRKFKLLFTWGSINPNFNAYNREILIKNFIDTYGQDITNISLNQNFNSHEKENLILWLLSPLIVELDNL